MPTNFQIALAKRIKDETGYEVDISTFVRTYAGRHLKAGGAFVWFFKDKSGLKTIGSTYTATECLRKDRYLSYTVHRNMEIEIFAEVVRNNER